ncbi:hypothetical protein XENOCAPTIV_012562 [Xenoophorus captivus]|uniref:Metalloendopeptidase n=1 Tax=Xenoophorus captivus TaxID=1517983 RepID=A0ABV0RHH3_9TELE
MTTRILTANNGSEEILLEGDIVAPKSRNAMNCWYNSCLWKKDSSGKVVVPYVISLNKQGCVYSGIAHHELNHALGFQHEQTRSDRNSYVRINWGNIIPQSAYNFYKHNINHLNTPYDYSSIMHYGRDAFAIA